MAVYRITRFTSVNMDRVIEKTTGMRDLLESIGAEFVDVVSDGRGNGMVIAKYRDSGTMDAATSTAQKVVGKQIEEGIIDGTSLDIWSGEIVMSF